MPYCKGFIRDTNPKRVGRRTIRGTITNKVTLKFVCHKTGQNVE